MIASVVAKFTRASASQASLAAAVASASASAPPRAAAATAALESVAPAEAIAGSLRGTYSVPSGGAAGEEVAAAAAAAAASAGSGDGAPALTPIGRHAPGYYLMVVRAPAPSRMQPCSPTHTRLLSLPLAHAPPRPPPFPPRAPPPYHPPHAQADDEGNVDADFPEIDGGVPIASVGVDKFVMCERGTDRPVLRLCIPEAALTLRAIERELGPSAELSVSCTVPQQLQLGARGSSGGGGGGGGGGRGGTAAAAAADSKANFLLVTLRASASAVSLARMGSAAALDAAAPAAASAAGSDGSGGGTGGAGGGGGGL